MLVKLFFGSNDELTFVNHLHISVGRRYIMFLLKIANIFIEPLGMQVAQDKLRTGLIKELTGKVTNLLCKHIIELFVLAADSSWLRFFESFFCQRDEAIFYVCSVS